MTDNSLALMDMINGTPLGFMLGNLKHCDWHIADAEKYGRVYPESWLTDGCYKPLQLSEIYGKYPVMRIEDDKDVFMEQLDVDIDRGDPIIIYCNNDTKATEFHTMLRKKDLKVLTLMSGFDNNDIRIIYDGKCDIVKALNTSDNDWWSKWDVIVYVGERMCLRLLDCYHRLYTYITEGTNCSDVIKAMKSITANERVVYFDSVGVENMMDLCLLEDNDMDSFLNIIAMDKKSYLSLEESEKYSVREDTLDKELAKIKYKELFITECKESGVVII